MSTTPRPLMISPSTGHVMSVSSRISSPRLISAVEMTFFSDLFFRMTVIGSFFGGCSTASTARVRIWFRRERRRPKSSRIVTPHATSKKIAPSKLGSDQVRASHTVLARHVGSEAEVVIRESTEKP